MIEQLRDVQIPFLACLLLLASGAKIFLPGGSGQAVAALQRRRSAVLGVACAEGILGVALLLTASGLVRLATIVFFATTTSVVGELARRGSDEGCGCFGALSTSPAGRRGVLRAALLTVAAIASAEVPETGVEVLGSATAWTVALLAAQAALLLALSPELADAVERTRHSVPCELRDAPLAETYATLRASVAWRHYVGMLTSTEPTEVWRELCHRFVVYRALVDDRPVDVVFAVPISGRRSEVRAAVVGEALVEVQDDDSGPQRLHSAV